MNAAATANASLQLYSEGPEQTARIAKQVGEAATPNLTIGLIGDLGAGKTCFVRGLAMGLGVNDGDAVTSPTFVLVHEYEGRLPLFHFDVYRLATPNQFSALGPEEYFLGGGVCVVEWADRVRDLLPIERLEIEIVHQSPTERRITLRAFGDLPAKLLDRLAKSIQ